MCCDARARLAIDPSGMISPEVQVFRHDQYRAQVKNLRKVKGQHQTIDANIYHGPPLEPVHLKLTWPHLGHILVAPATLA
mmetsp:Transcript_5787/g.17856  ORF Transcript_5787/g.17856 Transcript_5787/m.17856 type:complete len:80 (+) Transcript_5787:78-317(+)|eukprot:scaffold104218_cov36-Tisochrysis_lutea.AAC.1